MSRRSERRAVSVTLVVDPMFLGEDGSPTILGSVQILAAAERELRQQSPVEIDPTSARIEVKGFGRVFVSWLEAA